MTATQAPPRAAAAAERDSFAEMLRAEWTKFRTVRGWVIGITVAALVTVLVGLLSAAGSLSSCSINGQPCHLLHPVGPGGEAVTDTFYFVHRPLPGNGSITARVTSLTGLLPTATGGRVEAGQGPRSGHAPRPGTLVQGRPDHQGEHRPGLGLRGDHGHRRARGPDAVRLHPGHRRAAGRPTAASPRWLRLTRAGDTITGYVSADGTHWTQVGTATLAGLPATVQAGMFATSPP